jgi:putative ATP-dependent endonuclease of OLD family
MSTTAIIHRLRIERFRGIQLFDWLPKPGINAILGGGDVGKTTVLDALALLLSPSNATTISEADYWQRDTDAEFTIEATISLPASAEIENQKSMAYPWNWNGTEAVLPDDSGDEPAGADKPVYVIRVKGSAELEPVWEIAQPSGTSDHLSVSVRRKIGLVRLGSDERNDRDLRLVFGSALDRLMADPALRARIGKAVAAVQVINSMGDKSKTALTNLDARMQEATLPSNLKLGFTSSQGISIGALIGVLANHNGVHLPLSSWGAGTRRMAALEVAAATAANASFTTIDEIERGLEPYRLRKLISILAETAGQVFITTHSAVAISCIAKGNLWYLDAKGNIGHLPYDKIGAQQRRDPETFLAKLAVVGEGVTEVGLLRYLLHAAFSADPLDHGVRVCNGQGNEAVLGLLETLAKANLAFAALVDNEGNNSGRWNALRAKMNDFLFQWPKGCTEENIIATISDDKMVALVTNDEDGLTGYRLRFLADRLGIQDNDIGAIEAALKTEGKTLKTLIIEAASGSTDGAPDEPTKKQWKKHAQSWFKSYEGGEELAKKMASLGAWPTIQTSLLPLINVILVASGKPSITSLTL